MGDQVAGHLAGKLTDGVGAHAVSNHEDMPTIMPDVLVRSPHRDMAILIVQAPHSRVGISRLDDDIIPVHGLTLAS